MEQNMQMSKPFGHQDSEAKSDNIIRFDKSLQELKDLRSQLHYAAGYYEATFLNAKQKNLVIEDTKEYLCRAVVTVVDHLGNVSTNLNYSISMTNAFSEAELRINSLKQRLLSWEEYAHKLALSKVRWSANLPSHHRRYLSTPITYVERSNEDVRDSDSPAPPKTRGESLPLFLYTYPQKSSSPKNLPSIQHKDSSTSSTLALSVRDGISVQSKGSNPSFHFQVDTRKCGRNSLFRKSVKSRDLLSLIRRTKRTSLKY